MKFKFNIYSIFWILVCCGMVLIKDPKISLPLYLIFSCGFIKLMFTFFNEENQKANNNQILPFLFLTLSLIIYLLISYFLLSRFSFLSA